MMSCARWGILSLLLGISLPGNSSDLEAAVLHPHSTAWVNGSAVPSSTPVFPGDMIQTPTNSDANIGLAGSDIKVASGSLVEFGPNSVVLKHGWVGVVTSRKFVVRAGQVSVTPASTSSVKFEVLDLDGTVRVVALEGDLTIAHASGATHLAQGQSFSLGEDSGKYKKPAVAASAGGLLNSPWAMGAGLAVAGGITAWVITRPDNPVSPWRP